MPEILFEKRGAVAWITINRPQAMRIMLTCETAMVMMSKDAREGPRAFRDKRPAEFKGE